MAHQLANQGLVGHHHHGGFGRGPLGQFQGVFHRSLG